MQASLICSQGMIHFDPKYVDFKFFICLLPRGEVVVEELVTDLFNPFSLEFSGPLEHLGGAMDVIFVSQLLPAWGIRGNAFNQFLQI